MGPLLQGLLVLGLLAFLALDERLVTDPAPYLQAPLGLLVAAAGLALLNQIAVGLRFRMLARCVAAPLGRMNAVRLCAWGNLFSLFGLGGGDVARLVLLRRHGMSAGCGTAVIVIDRFTALLGLMTIASCGALLLGDRIASTPLGVMVAAVHLATAICLCGLAGVIGGRAPAFSWARLGSMVVPVAVAAAGVVAYAGRLVDIVGCAAVVGGSALGACCAVGLDRLTPRASVAAAMGENPLRNPARPAWLVRLATIAGETSRTVGIFRRRPMVLVVTTVLSVLCQLPLVVAAAVLTWAFTGSSQLHIESQMLATAVAILTMAIPLPGGGLGVGEVAYDQIVRSAIGGSLGLAGVFLGLRILMVLAPVAFVLLPPLLSRSMTAAIALVRATRRAGSAGGVDT